MSVESIAPEEMFHFSCNLPNSIPDIIFNYQIYPAESNLTKYPVY